MALKCDITLDDFARQLDRLLVANGPAQVLHMFGIREQVLAAGEWHENWQDELRRIRDIINAMTVHERRNPDRLDIDQVLRVAMLSGTKPRDVTDFLRQFGEMRERMAEIMSRGGP